MELRHFNSLCREILKYQTIIVTPFESLFSLRKELLNLLSLIIQIYLFTGRLKCMYICICVYVCVCVSFIKRYFLI